MAKAAFNRYTQQRIFPEYTERGLEDLLLLPAALKGQEDAYVKQAQDLTFDSDALGETDEAKRAEIIDKYRNIRNQSVETLRREGVNSQTSIDALYDLQKKWQADASTGEIAAISSNAAAGKKYADEVYDRVIKSNGDAEMAEFARQTALNEWSNKGTQWKESGKYNRFQGIEIPKLIDEQKYIAELVKTAQASTYEKLQSSGVLKSMGINNYADFMAAYQENKIEQLPQGKIEQGVMASLAGDADFRRSVAFKNAYRSRDYSKYNPEAQPFKIEGEGENAKWVTDNPELQSMITGQSYLSSYAKQEITPHTVAQAEWWGLGGNRKSENAIRTITNLDSGSLDSKDWATRVKSIDNAKAAQQDLLAGGVYEDLDDTQKQTYNKLANEIKNQESILTERRKIAYNEMNLADLGDTWFSDFSSTSDVLGEDKLEDNAGFNKKVLTLVEEFGKSGKVTVTDQDVISTALNNIPEGGAILSASYNRIMKKGKDATPDELASITELQQKAEEAVNTALKADFDKKANSIYDENPEAFSGIINEQAITPVDSKGNTLSLTKTWTDALVDDPSQFKTNGGLDLGAALVETLGKDYKTKIDPSKTQTRINLNQSGEGTRLTAIYYDLLGNELKKFQINQPETVTSTPMLIDLGTNLIKNGATSGQDEQGAQVIATRIYPDSNKLGGLDRQDLEEKRKTVGEELIGPSFKYGGNDITPTFKSDGKNFDVDLKSSGDEDFPENLSTLVKKLYPDSETNTPIKIGGYEDASKVFTAVTILSNQGSYDPAVVNYFNNYLYYKYYSNSPNTETPKENATTKEPTTPTGSSNLSGGSTR